MSLSHAIESSPPSLLPRMLASVAAGLIGLLIGAAVAAESLLAYSLENVRFYREMPFLITAAVLCGLTGIFFVVLRRARLFTRRFDIAVIMLLLAGGVNGLNLGRLDPADLALVAVLSFGSCFLVVEQRPLRIQLAVLSLVLLLIACSVLSTANGGIGTVLGQRTLLNKCLALLLMATLTAHALRHRLAARTLFVVALVSALLAVATSLIHRSTGIALTAEDLAQFRYKSTPLGQQLRATGLTATPQTLAHLLLLGLSMGLFLPMSRVARVLLVFAIGLGIGFTFTMGGYSVYALVLLLALFLHWPRRSLHLLILLGLGALLIYFSGLAEWIVDRVIVPLGGKGTEDRVGYLQAGIEAIQRHPFAGIGLRSIGRLLPTPVHNAYVQFAAEIGILGGAVFISLIGYLTAGAAVVVRRLPAGEEKNWMKGLLLGMIALALHLFVEPFYDNYLSWVFMGVVAGALAFHERQRISESMARSAPDREERVSS